MKFRNILILITYIILTGCEKYHVGNFKNLNLETEKKYKNSGFEISECPRFKDLGHRPKSLRSCQIDVLYDYLCFYML